MSRTRDIAQFLGKTEANNTSNIRLLKVGDAVASDEETLADITVDGGGNVDRVLAGSVSVGDAVILTPENLVKKVGQPFERHEILHTFLMDSDGSGNDPYIPYGYQGYSPQIFYLGYSKIMFVGVTGTTGRGTLFAQMARLDPTGHRIEKIGPARVMQSSYYTSSTSYGGAMSDNYCAVQGENNRIHVGAGYEYRNSTNNYDRLYVYTVYPEDVEDSENLTILSGTTQSPSSGAPTSTYRTVCSSIFGNYTLQSQNSSYYGGSFWFWRNSRSDQGFCTFVTSGDTANIITSSNYSTSVGRFDNFNYGQRPWYNAKADKWVCLGLNNSTGDYQLQVFEMKGPGGGSNYYMNYNTPLISDTETNTNWGRAGCYDSSAGLSIVAYRDNNNVGKLRTVNSVSTSTIDPTIGNAYEFTGTLEGDVQLFHDKSVQKNAVLFTDYNSNPDRARIRWFTADSDGTISLEDSTHTMIGDSAWTYSQSYGLTVNKLDDFDTCILTRVKNWSPNFPNRSSWPSNSTFMQGLQVFHPERRQATNLTNTGANYLGIAQQAGDSGDTINIKIHGAIDTNQVGLVPNTTYYLNEINGDLEPNTNNGSIRAGYAVAANQLKILTQSGESA